jgi:hypothetical protein
MGGLFEGGCMFRILSAVSFLVAAALVALGVFIALATPTFQNVVIEMVNEQMLVYLLCAGLLLGTLTGIVGVRLYINSGWWIPSLLVGAALAVLAYLTLTDHMWLTHALGIQSAQNVFGIALALAAANVIGFGKQMEKRFIYGR